VLLCRASALLIALAAKRGFAASKAANFVPRSKISPNKRPPLDRNHRSSGPSRTSDPPNVQDLDWALPDHLSHLYHLLPAASPVPLSVPSLNPLPPNDSQSGSNAASPSASSSSHSSQSEAHRLLEPPTRIRYPARRMSMPDMKKRTKTMLDYLARIQVEMAARSDSQPAVLLAHMGRPAPAPPQPGQLASVSMMDDLSRELIRFQERYL
jgi:hypothetical protein